MQPTLNPYLIFNGNASEAMRYYQSVLGGKLTMQTFDEAKMAKTHADKKRIIHAELKNDALSFMASDSPTDRNKQAQFGSNVHLSIVGSDTPKLTGFFNRLAEGGNVDMPLAKQFWGDTFGMCTDKFSVHWMVNIVTPKS